MTVTQTVDIPASRRIMIDVPAEVPEGRTNVILTFPIAESSTEPERRGSPLESAAPEGSDRETADSPPKISANGAAWLEFMAALKDTEPLPGDDLPPRWKSTRKLPL